MAELPAMKLGLGTVQFGMDYGISNSRGRIPEPEAAEILDLASRSGVQVLDTAQVYGDSEAVLGRTLPAQHDFRIVTKAAPIAGQKNQAAMTLREEFQKSLQRLRQKSIYALLCHDAAQLLGPSGSVLWREMTALRNEGLVQKIGASVYTRSEISQLLAAFEIEIVQLPFNLLDQRPRTGGELVELKRRGVEIHTRSTFLQGILLADPQDLDERFLPLRKHLDMTRKYLGAHDLTALQGALACTMQQAEINTVLVGVTAVAELREILSAVDGLPARKIDFSTCALSDERFLNPSCWGSLPKDQLRRSQPC
jgi:aryl-alcohol dehydrogenase-like predicted oxidoreductase